METLKLFFQTAFYTVIYLLGYKSGKSTQDNKMNEAALKEANATLDKQNKVRVKYAKIRNKVPASWDDTTERLPKANSAKK